MGRIFLTWLLGTENKNNHTVSESMPKLSFEVFRAQQSEDLIQLKSHHVKHIKIYDSSV